MAGQTGPKDPAGRESGDKVRQLQRQLWAAAKRAPGRRFHALYGQICRGDVLQEAWKRVRRNRGAAGVDRVTIDEVERYGVERFLEELGEVLRAGEYGAQVVRRAYIPKADGARRPLGIPTVRDRVAQMAAKLVLEPIFEADFGACSYGFRPRRSAQQALERLRQLGNAANHFIDVDDYVVKRLRGLRVKRAGRNVRAGQTRHWDRDYFESFGLHRLRGTIRYPGKPPGKGRIA
ncbi:MAG TPA: reverse transcriptase domain-containing protein [Burkholderiaceae bacterium]|nr:reverse transcriptase domain-containing protein [Burkholderiaceae bacterium]